MASLAQPSPQSLPSGEAFASFRAAVDKAEALAKQSDWNGAARELQAALNAIPQQGEVPMIVYLAKDRVYASLIDNAAVRFDDAQHLLWLDRRVAMRAEFWGADEPATLAVRNARANAWCQVGRCADALKEQEVIYGLTLKQLGPDARNTLVARHNMTTSLSDMGREAQALAIDRELAAQAERLWGPTDALTLSFRNGVAVALTELGQYADSLAEHEQLYELRQKALGPKSPATLNSLRSIGFTYGLLSRYRESLAAAQRVLTLTREAVGTRHPQTALAQTDLALALRRVGRMAEAQTQSREAWKLLEELRGPLHPDTLVAMNVYGSVLLRTDDAETALEVTQAALSRRLQQTSELHPLVLRARQSAGQALLKNGQVDAALVELEKTHQGMRQVFGDTHPETLLVLLDRMEAAQAAGQLDSMRPWLKNFQEGVEALRAQHGLSVKSRRVLFERYVDGYRLQALSNMRAGQSDTAFELAELSKARTLLESTALQYANRSGVLPTDAQAQVHGHEARLAQIDRTLDNVTQPDRRQALEAERNRVVRAYADTTAELRQRYPRYARLVAPPQATLADAQRWLPPDVLFVSYLVSRDRVMAFAVDHTGLRSALELPALNGLADTVDAFRRLTGDALDEGQAVWQTGPERFRVGPKATTPVSGAQEVTDAGAIGRVLAQHLLAPLGAELASHSRLLISPDGALAQLPFEALPMGDAWLAQSHGVSYVQSLSMLGLVRQRSAQYQKLSPRKALLAVGNPDYRISRGTGPAANSDPSPAGKRSAASPAAGMGLDRTAAASALAESDDAVNEAMNVLREADWDALPGTEREVAAVKQVVNAGRVDTLTGSEASEARLQALNQSGDLRQYARLLFSVHGFLSPGVPTLNALVLSQVNNPTGVDGYVTAAEWPGYDLHSDLVVMSACETGLGKVVQGEGVMGLPYALYVAGNTHTVMTLWQVADESTARFMEAFFKRLNQGRTADMALAETKRDFANGVYGDKLRRPVYWAPFVLYGGGEPSTTQR